MSTIATTRSLPRRPGLLEGAGRRVVRRVLDRLAIGRVTLIDGQDVVVAGDGAPAATVRVHDPAFYSSVAFGGSIGAAESYMDGQWSCDDLSTLIELITHNEESMRGMEGPLRSLSRPFAKLGYMLQANTRAGSRSNVGAHYDLSNEFFSLWLDPTMTYSSAIFPREGASLEEAQVEKIDRACRKLRLSPADHLLEIGTGWGSVALHAAREYGCRVTTTTISARQREEAQRRVDGAGLTDRVTILGTDYRDLKGRYDKLISIEMIEAVGRDFLDGYFAKVSSLLEPDGLALIQAITIRDQRWAEASRRRDFLKKYIFPGSCLLGVERMARSVRTSTDMRILDLEDIGGHYVRTLRLWRAAFDASIDDVRALGFDDRFCRMWQYYLSYCEGVFRTGTCSDVQLLLARPGVRATMSG